MKEIKVGIIGTGFMGPVHIEALRRLMIQRETVALQQFPGNRAFVSF